MALNRPVTARDTHGAPEWWTRISSRHGVRLQLTAWYGGVLIVLLVVLGLFVYWLLSSNLRRDAESQLKSKAGLIGSTLNVDQGGINFQDIQAPGEIVLIYSNKGSLLESTGVSDGGRNFNPPSLPSWAYATGAQGMFNTVTLANGRWLLYAQSLSEGDQSLGAGWMIVGRSLEPMYDLLNQTLYSLALAGPLVILLACIGGYFLAGRALAPVSAITRTARRIQAEGLGKGHTARIGMEGRRDELGELASTFDDMLAHLEGSFKRERRFTADAAHELRTPLAVVQAETSLALSRPRRAAEYERVLFVVESETARMGKLVADLLTLARADESYHLLAREQVDLSSLCRVVACRLSEIALEKGVTPTADIVEGIRVVGDDTWLEQMLLNLVENAVKYTGAGGYVTLGLIRNSNQIEISVEDSGVGISKDELPYIFDRFYRVDKSRSRDSGSAGIGLGLAICEWVAKSHGGHIDVSSQTGQGSRFVVYLQASCLLA